MTVSRFDDHLLLEISDDGSGFPDIGEREGEAVQVAMKPATINGRILQHGGQLDVTTCVRGARLRIMLPAN